MGPRVESLAWHLSHPKARNGGLRHPLRPHTGKGSPRASGAGEMRTPYRSPTFISTSRRVSCAIGRTLAAPPAISPFIVAGSAISSP